MGPEPTTIDCLRLLAAVFAWPTPERLRTVRALAQSLVERAHPQAALIQAILEHGEESESEYHFLFSGNVRCSPYASEYGPNRSTRKAFQLADIAGFYRAFGLAVDEDTPDMADHISPELDFLAYVGFKLRYATAQGWEESAQVCDAAYRTFLAEHLAPWVECFAERIRRHTDSDSLYRKAAEFLLAQLHDESERLAVLAAPVAYAPGARELSCECGGPGT